MFTKTITYTDYMGEERTEDFLFHLSENELHDLLLEYPYGFERTMAKYMADENYTAIKAMMINIVTKAYGERSIDGRRFSKSEEILKNFTETPAFSDYILELVSDEKASTEFVRHVIPKKVLAEVQKREKEEQAAGLANKSKKSKK